MHGNVIICITRLYTPLETSFSEEEDPLDHAPSPRKTLELLDPSGTYLVEACVRMKENSSSTLRDKCIEELLAFDEIVKGAIDFQVPDRLALDTRVRGS